MARVVIRSGVAACAALLLAVAAPAASAQSLAEVARQEEARRSRARGPAKVYTNEDLVPDFTRPEPGEPAGTAADVPAAPMPDADAPGTASNVAEGDVGAGATDVAAPVGAGIAAAPVARDVETPAPQRPSDLDETYWRERAVFLRERRDNKTREIAVIRERLASFDSRPDSPERAIVASALARAVADLDSFTEEWLRFERLARERGVPEAWIR